MRDVNGMMLRHKPTKFSNGAERRFQACWVDGREIISCGHRHSNVIGAAECGPPGSFVRAVNNRMWHEITMKERALLNEYFRSSG